jgi:hypothetical protein
LDPAGSLADLHGLIDVPSAWGSRLKPLAHGHNKHQHFAIQHSETLARSQRIQNELIVRGTTIFSSRREAGDRIRTGDVQLGKLTFYH